MGRHFTWDYEEYADPPFYHIYHLDTAQACVLWDETSLYLHLPESEDASALVGEIVGRLDALAELVEDDDG